MSTSRNSACGPSKKFLGPSKKISSWVRPGVCEVRASALRPVRALIRLDLPTLERPANATSVPAIGGRVSIEGDAQMNCQSPANSRRPCSRSFASSSEFIRTLSVRRGEELLHRPGPPKLGERRRKQSSLACSSGLLRGVWPPAAIVTWSFWSKGRLQVVEQLHLHAVTAHDETLLQHREGVVPGPVDHETGREGRQHEGEDQRHPVEDHLLGR